MTGPLFLTLTRLDHPRHHRDYNAWHQLDHLPENRVLPGVSWGDRWVRDAACADASVVPDPQHREHQYAVAYGFRDPTAVAAWTELNQRAVWWGRRPELGWTHRAPIGFFDPIKGYAAPRVLVAPEALPHRPHRGVHLTLSRLTEPGSAAAVDLLADLDRVRFPAALDVPGVAGGWSYRFTAGAHGMGDGAADDSDRAGVLLRLLYIDDEVIATTRTLRDRVPSWTDEAPAGETVQFSSPMVTISPWEWDWFDGEPARG
ncbi:hypothetical protein GCM10017691_37750 [Pseudonocardia petroleophila]|uniref:Uncharacterized protein n=1 Tax=Pseudonocardia petroleophila TaxID=37331 RepID=A0A7G7MCG8_9PSEU|nr:hypothetical protein [Pseudonocardia petroleophila]QNG50479.1 hypothetical protein H6H00_19850 [Pseudonocardia petroleophila]